MKESLFVLSMAICPLMESYACPDTENSGDPFREQKSVQQWKLSKLYCPNS